HAGICCHASSLSAPSQLPTRSNPVYKTKPAPPTQSWLCSFGYHFIVIAAGAAVLAGGRGGLRYGGLLGAAAAAAGPPCCGLVLPADDLPVHGVVIHTAVGHIPGARPKDRDIPLFGHRIPPFLPAYAGGRRRVPVSIHDPEQAVNELIVDRAFALAAGSAAAGAGRPAVGRGGRLRRSGIGPVCRRACVGAGAGRMRRAGRRPAAGTAVRVAGAVGLLTGRAARGSLAAAGRRTAAAARAGSGRTA